MSLRRGFRQAGARTVVSTLWRVDDDATRVLMGEFYHRLWEVGASPSDALPWGDSHSNGVSIVLP